MTDVKPLSAEERPHYEVWHESSIGSFWLCEVEPHSELGFIRKPVFRLEHSFAPWLLRDAAEQARAERDAEWSEALSFGGKSAMDGEPVKFRTGTPEVAKSLLGLGREGAIQRARAEERERCKPFVDALDQIANQDFFGQPEGEPLIQGARRVLRENAEAAAAIRKGGE